VHAAPQAPAGWYPDPTGRHEHRYWLGTTWSEHVADSGKQSTDRLTVTLPAANTAADWIERRSWLRWGYPANAIRGESQYQDTIRNLPGITPGLVEDVRLEPVEVDLVRELTNRYDRFACQALVAGSLVGYLARECASVLAPLVDAAGVSSWRVAGAVVGGSHGADLYGVHIWLDRRLTVGPSWPPEP
jgi:hypothetical protein